MISLCLQNTIKEYLFVKTILASRESKINYSFWPDRHCQRFCSELLSYSVGSCKYFISLTIGDVPFRFPWSDVGYYCQVSCSQYQTNTGKGSHSCQTTLPSYERQSAQYQQCDVTVFLQIFTSRRKSIYKIKPLDFGHKV